MKIKQILDRIRTIQEENTHYTARPLTENNAPIESDNFLTKSKVLMEEAVKNSDKKKVLTEETEENDKSKTLKKFIIKRNTPQFGDIRASQEDAIRKTISENVKMSEDALIYYPEIDDITMNGKIDSMSLSFQFRLNSASGDGCYIWTEALCLSEANVRTIGKIRDAFANWKDSLTQDGQLMDNLKKESTKNK